MEYFTDYYADDSAMVGNGPYDVPDDGGYDAITVMTDDAPSAVPIMVPNGGEVVPGKNGLILAAIVVGVLLMGRKWGR